MRGLFLLQSLMLLLLGIVVGLIVSLSLPSFLPPELAGTSYFTLPIPPGVAAVSAVISVAAGIVPFIKRRF